MSDGMNQLANGAKLIGETILPGASLLMDGKLGAGTAHALLGIGARLALGPIGWGALAVNSYCKSVSGQHVWEMAGDMVSEARKKVHPDAPAASGEEAAPITPAPAKASTAKG